MIVPFQETRVWQLIHPFRQDNQLAAVVSIIFPAVTKIFFDSMTNLHIEIFIYSDITTVKKSMKVSSQEYTVADFMRTF